MVRFLDKDSSGTIDVGEVDEAVREFRELSRDMPSLGTGPMTVIDSSEIDRLARRTFGDLVRGEDPPAHDIVATSSDNNTSNNQEEASGDHDHDDNNKGAVGYNPGAEGADDVEFAQPVAATQPNDQDSPEAEAAGGDGGGSGSGSDEAAQKKTVSVPEISAAFERAFRQFKSDGEGQHSIGAMRHPGTQQPSTDTRHAKVSHIVRGTEHKQGC